MSVDLGRQIACVQREIALRQTVYPRQVAAKKLTPEKAAYELRCMNGVLDTLTMVSKGLPKWDGVERRKPNGEEARPALPEDTLDTVGSSAVSASS